MMSAVKASRESEAPVPFWAEVSAPFTPSSDADKLWRNGAYLHRQLLSLSSGMRLLEEELSVLVVLDSRRAWYVVHEVVAGDFARNTGTMGANATQSYPHLPTKAPRHRFDGALG